MLEGTFSSLTEPQGVAQLAGNTPHEAVVFSSKLSYSISLGPKLIKKKSVPILLSILEQHLVYMDSLLQMLWRRFPCFHYAVVK